MLTKDSSYFRVIKLTLIVVQIVTVVLAIVGLIIAFGYKVDESEEDRTVKEQILDDLKQEELRKHCERLSETLQKCSELESILEVEEKDSSDNMPSDGEYEDYSEAQENSTDSTLSDAAPTMRPNKVTKRSVDNCNQTKNEHTSQCSAFNSSAEATAKGKPILALLDSTSNTKTGATFSVNNLISMTKKQSLTLVKILSVALLVLQPIGLIATFSENSNILIIYCVALALFAIHLLFVDIITGVLITIFTCIAFVYFHSLIATQSQMQNKFVNLNKQV